MGTWASHVAQERHGHLGCGMKHFAGQQLERRLVFEWKALRTIRHTGTPSKNDEKTLPFSLDLDLEGCSDVHYELLPVFHPSK